MFDLLRCRALLAALVMAVLSCGSSVWAQSQSPGPSGEEVQARLQAVSNDASLTAEQRAARVEVLNQTLAALAEEKRWAAEATRLEAERIAAPQRVAALEAELDAPPATTAPELDDSIPLSEVEAGLAAARANLDSLRAEADRLAQEQRRRVERRPELPDALNQVRQAEQQLTQELLDAGADTISELDDADATLRNRLDLLRARMAARRAQLAALEEELVGQALLDTVTDLRVRVQARRVQSADSLLALWQETVDRRRRIETERALVAADDAARRVDSVPAALRADAERNAQLAARVGELLARKEALGSLQSVVVGQLQAVRDADAAARLREEAAGLTDAVGALLRKEKAELPPVRELERRTATRRDEMSNLRFEGLQAAEEARALADPEAASAALVATTAGVGTSDELRAAARALIEERSGYLEAQITLSDAAFVQLASLAQNERSLIDSVRAFRLFIDERVLWIRSSQPIWQQDFSGVAALGFWLADPGHWLEALWFLGDDARRNPLLVAFLFLCVVGLFASRGRMRRVLDEAGVQASRRACVSVLPSWRALGATLVLVLAAPATLAFVGWRLSAVAAPEFPKALGLALQGAALVVLITEGLRVVYRPGGLGQAHFGWSESIEKRMRVPSFVLLVSAVPSLALAMLIEAQDNAVWKGSVGRVLFAFALLAFARFLFIHVREVRRVRPIAGWQRQAWALGQFASAAVPVCLAVMALGSYAFTAVQLLDRLLLTAVLITALVLLHAMGVRALLMARRRLSQRELRRKLGSQEEADASLAGGEVIDIARVDAQSRQAVAAVFGFTFVIGLWVVWADVLPALQLLDRVELWSHEVVNAGGSELVPVTLGGVLLAVVVMASAMLVNRNLPGVLELTVLQRLQIGSGEKYAIKAVIQYIVTLVGVIWAFSALGVAWVHVQWLAAAMSVGLGFGLQEIFANFVSGLIILGERPVRVGDWVTVGEVTGKVTRIRMRATTLVDRDNCEWLVPNRQFVTGNLSNWTLSDPTTRVVLPVGVAYGSDTERASEILLEVARETEGVMQEPLANTIFRGFGDNSLDLELRFYIAGRDAYPAILDPVCTAVHKRFAEEGIEIAFPQRDLHIRSASGLVELVRDGGGSAPVGAAAPVAG